MSVKPAMQTAKDTAAYMGLGLREVRRLVKAGELDVKYIGKHNSREYRIITESADAYIASLPSEPRSA